MNEQSADCSVLAPLFGGLAALPIGMAESEAEAIVQVTQGMGEVGCTGVMISPGLVMTAAHCIQQPDEGVVVRIGRHASSPVAEVGVSNVERLSGSDLALLSLDNVSDLDGYVSPIALASAPLPPRRDGQLAVVAGYGVTESLDWGERRFAFVSVTESIDEWIVTQPTGVSGACIGDSGGPLLWRDEAGLLRVFGILSDGDASCRGSDRFVRVAGRGLEGITATAPPAGCVGLPVVGSCFATALAAWCEGSTLATERCETGSSCGYSESVNGYRCVMPEQDGCRGYDSWGVCDGDRAIRCDEGELVSRTCSCGGCVRSAASGRVGCQP